MYGLNIRLFATLLVNLLENGECFTFFQSHFLGIGLRRGRCFMSSPIVAEKSIDPGDTFPKGLLVLVFTELFLLYLSFLNQMTKHKIEVNHGGSLTRPESGFAGPMTTFHFGARGVYSTKCSDIHRGIVS
jgi:hypothetical protein